MSSSPQSKLAKLQSELERAEQAAERDWRRRTDGVPERFLAQLRADHAAKWSEVLDLLRREIARLSTRL